MKIIVKFLTIPFVFLLVLPVYYLYRLVEKNDLNGSKYLIYLVYFFLIPTYLISCLVPKEKNFWIFGTYTRKKFSENSKYLFLYVKRNHPEIKPIWLTSSDTVIEELSKKGFESYKTLSIKGFFYSMQAGCVIVNDTLGDVNRFVTGQAKKIQLWHGIPLKKVAYKGKSDLYKILAKIRNKIMPFVEPDWDIFLTASKENQKQIEDIFLIKKEYLPITGLPRNDSFFKTSWLFDNKCERLEDLKKKINFRYLFTYLPTHRMQGKKRVDLFEKFGFKIEEANKFLEKINALLIIKAHASDARLLTFPKYNNNKSRIYVFSDLELPDPYPLLKETDVLLTDYSSVFFDYLLLDRPIIFTPFDYDEYKKEEGFLYDYDELTPGPKAKNWSEIFNLIERILEKDDWREARNKICKRFQKFKDNKNSERAFETIKKIL